MHPDFSAFVDSRVRREPDWRRPGEIAAVRAHLAQWSAALPPIGTPGPMQMGDFALQVGGVRLASRLYMPEGPRSPPGLVWFHGGGWFAGSIDTHDGLCRHLCTALELAVISVGLPLVPEVDGATQANLALGALDTISQARDRLQLHTKLLLAGGDGTGALSALMAALRLNARRPATVNAALLLCPASKPDLQTGSYLRHRDDPVLSRDRMAAAWSMRLGSAWGDWHPDLIPFHFPVEQLSVPSMIVAAQRDVLHEDAVHLHDFLAANGARVEFCGAPEMPHDFARMAGMSPTGRKLLDEITQLFRRGFVDPLLADPPA